MAKVETSELEPGNYLVTVTEKGYRLWRVEDDMTWNGYYLRGLSKAFQDLNGKEDDGGPG